MDKHSKTMFLVTLLLFVVLLTKSMLIDPVKSRSGEETHYKNFALEIAPDIHKNILLRTGLLTYRIISVQREKEDGTTRVRYSTQTGDMVEETLKGQYSAKARVYALYIFPFKDFIITGGLKDNEV